MRIGKPGTEPARDMQRGEGHTAREREQRRGRGPAKVVWGESLQGKEAGEEEEWREDKRGTGAYRGQKGEVGEEWGRRRCRGEGREKGRRGMHGWFNEPLCSPTPQEKRLLIMPPSSRAGGGQEGCRNALTRQSSTGSGMGAGQGQEEC